MLENCKIKKNTHAHTSNAGYDKTWWEQKDDLKMDMTSQSSKGCETQVWQPQVAHPDAIIGMSACKTFSTSVACSGTAGYHGCLKRYDSRMHPT